MKVDIKKLEDALDKFNGNRVKTALFLKINKKIITQLINSLPELKRFRILHENRGGLVCDTSKLYRAHMNKIMATIDYRNSDAIKRAEIEQRVKRNFYE